MRDPRLIPHSGDILEFNGYRRKVTISRGFNVDYERTKSDTENGKVRLMSCWITTWRDWARNAHVVNRAE